MSQEGCTRKRVVVPVRLLRFLFLLAALVGASALRPAVAMPLKGGNVIAFESDSALYVTDDGGGAPTEIVSANDGVNMQPALSPDGSRVAFSSQRDGKFSIYVVNVDGTGLRRVTDGSGNDSEPAWSPDGARLAFVRGFDATGGGFVVLGCVLPGHILVVSVDEGFNGQRPTAVNLTNGQGGGTDPAWSPDGTRIAFASNRDDPYNYDIYTMSSGNGGKVQRLTQSESQDADPAWSPDGTWIVYTSGLKINGGSQCGNMPIVGDGECDKDECDDEAVGSFTSAGGPYIYRMAADGSQQENLTGADYATEPDWSPDGSQIVFVGERKGENVELYTTAWEGKGPWVQLTFSKAQKSSPTWVGAGIR